MESREQRAWESPLRAMIDDPPRRARFSVTPKIPEIPDIGNHLLAGAVDVDITPAPGIPKAGYSKNAHFGEGFHTRIRARIIHLRTGTTSIALVQLDLLGGSAVLHHLIARSIADTTDVPLHGLFLGATHTHGGPGAFLGGDFQNHWASNKPGFDPAYTQFVVDRIAEGIVETVEQRRPAVAAFGSAEVWGFTRNRSLEPHICNTNVTDKRTDPQQKWKAINPELHLLRVDGAQDGGGHVPMGAMAIFSIHGTGVSHHDRLYNADVWAYLTVGLADRIESTHGTRPVVGAIEGTHGDMTPAIRPGRAGHVESKRLGLGIAAAAAELYGALEPALSGEVELASGLREIDVAANPSAGGVTLPAPAVGAATIAGAKENMTPVINRIPPFAAGYPKHWHGDGPQGAKWITGTRWLQPIVIPRKAFPRVLPVHVLRIGTTMMVGLPFEMTVEAGRRIAASVSAEVAGDSVDSVVMTSVVDDYWCYLTTPEEYMLQFYEGGNTLYGPRTLAYATAHAVRTAADVIRKGALVDIADRRSFDLGAKRFLARPQSGPTSRREVRAPRFIDPSASDDGYWSLTWIDAAPGNLAWHAPMVSVEQSVRGGNWEPAVSNGRRVDDQGWDISVMSLGDKDGGHRYEARWWSPEIRRGVHHRFVLEPNAGGRSFYSSEFD